MGVYTKITLYSKDYKTDLLGIKHDIQTESHTVNVGVLNLGVIKDKEDAEVVIKSTKPFSKAKLTFGGVKLELGATTVNYAFVRMTPDAVAIKREHQHFARRCIFFKPAAISLYVMIIICVNQVALAEHIRTL